MEVLQEGLDSINAHVVSLGGEVKSAGDFDPTKSHKSTTADSMMPIRLGKEEEDKYDPTKVSDMIEQIKKQRESQLEGRINDRQIKVINTTSSGVNLKDLLFNIDQQDF